MSTVPKNQIMTLCATTDSIDRTLQRFLEIEDIPTVVKSNTGDSKCKEIYRSSITRKPGGRYVVHLPISQYPPSLGKSKEVSLNRLRQLENRFRKSPELRSDYNNTDLTNDCYISFLWRNPWTNIK
jgi:hypothetical protein